MNSSRFLLRQRSEAKWIILFVASQSRLQRVLRDICPMLFKAFVADDLYFGKPSLPNPSFESKLVRQPMRKPAFDQLHCLFDGHAVGHGNKQMNVIRHNDKIVQFKLPFLHQRTQHVDQQARIALRLK
jgi:hypothetical protein